jgi:hypothetical protein
LPPLHCSTHTPGRGGVPSAGVTGCCCLSKHRVGWVNLLFLVWWYLLPHNLTTSGTEVVYLPELTGDCGISMWFEFVFSHFEWDSHTYLHLRNLQSPVPHTQKRKMSLYFLPCESSVSILNHDHIILVVLFLLLS